jgi:cell division protein FtsN
MPRDYKHARRKSRSSGFSGWTGLFVGLALGLCVAGAVYLHEHRGNAQLATPTAPLGAESHRKETKHAPAPQSAEPQLDFYDILPKYQVVVPEKDGNVRPNAAAKVERPGVYIVQAGSYRNYADADHIRALLALQGVESTIQKVTVDNDTWHRVRIGPIAKLTDLEETRRKLREAQVDALVIRVGD